MTINKIKNNILCLIFICSAFISCRQQNKGYTFIVPPDTMPTYKQSDSGIPKPPPPNRAYYFASNFIIDKEGKVYFFQQQYKLNHEKVDWNTPPVFINLAPKDIVEIPDDNVEEFIKLNILNRDTLKRDISIASEKDTIRSVGLSKIIAICNKNEYHIRWKFRKVTQEETIVLSYKKNQKDYYPYEINWDTTRIIIPMNIIQKEKKI